jgi:hypothetical protein
MAEGQLAGYSALFAATSTRRRKPAPRFEHGSPDEPKEPGFHGKPIASSLLRQSPLAMHQDGGLIFTAHSTWQKNKSVPYSRLLE